jgi:uncharacterized OB-fold protein
MADELLTAELIIEYPFSRTTGPVIGAFFTALREGFIVGIKAKDGRVLVPPFEYDPDTSEALTEMVEVGDAGTVASWAWVKDPLDGQPLDRPFAFALVKLDGADTPMLHAVDTGGDESAVRTGLRVVAKWRDEREGHIQDIECFVPEGASA